MCFVLSVITRMLPKLILKLLISAYKALVNQTSPPLHTIYVILEPSINKISESMTVDALVFWQAYNVSIFLWRRPLCFYNGHVVDRHCWLREWKNGGTSFVGSALLRDRCVLLRSAWQKGSVRGTTKRSYSARAESTEGSLEGRHSTVRR